MGYRTTGGIVNSGSRNKKGRIVNSRKKQTLLMNSGTLLQNSLIVIPHSLRDLIAFCCCLQPFHRASWTHCQHTKNPTISIVIEFLKTEVIDLSGIVNADKIVYGT